MLRELTIRNFAIIDDLSMTFDNGLIVLTGETGAGKSIIIKAVDLILGGRVASDLIRSSQDTAELEALFEVPVQSQAGEMASQQGFDLSEGLLVRRLIQRNGRHKIYINGRLATTHMLSSMSNQLASIAGQHSHQALLNTDYHLMVLDQFGDLGKLRQKVSACYKKILPLIAELRTLRRQLAEQAQRCELLAFQAQEIGRAGIAPGEDEVLEQQRQRLKNAERLYETVGGCVELLYGGDGAVVERVADLTKELQLLCPVDPALSPIAQRINDVAFELEDIARELQAYLQGIVFDTDRLESVEQRLDALQQLKRKYGDTMESVIAFGQRAEEELKRASCLPEEIDKKEKCLQRTHEELVALCRRLSRRRRQAAKGFAKAVQQEVGSLGMKKTRFDVRFAPVPVDDSTDPYLAVDESGIEATGMERAEFFISPNVGEDLRPLARIASGGELSRIILALKAILATGEAVETLVFDEVDAGIGGGVAEMVGEKLSALARYHQVICITHLPQIARFGKSHFKIEKHVHHGRTSTAIRPLQGEDRVKELARMLGGIHITKQTLAHAREMMDMGRKNSEP